MILGRAEVTRVKVGTKGRKVLIIDELDKNVDLDTAMQLVREGSETIVRFLTETVPEEVLSLLGKKLSQKADYQRNRLFTIDYSPDNLMRHLKVLAVLGLWKINWDKVNKILNLPNSAMIQEIDEELYKRIAVEIGLSKEVEWNEVVGALGLPKNTTFAEVIDVFCEKKFEERAKEGKPLL